MSALAPPQTRLQARVQERGAINLALLDRADLEALCALKFWEELGLRLEEAQNILNTSTSLWMRSFLDHPPRAIGEAPIDLEALTRARARIEPTTQTPRPLVCIKPQLRSVGETQAHDTQQAPEESP